MTVSVLDGMYLVRGSNCCMLSKLYGGGRDWKNGKLPKVSKKELWNCYAASCPGSSLLPAKCGSAVSVAVPLRQCFFCYFLSLKDFKSHFP